MKNIHKAFNRFIRGRRYFSNKIVVEESVGIENKSNPLAKHSTEINDRISQMLEIPEIIDYNQAPLFRGNLILCPTPIGNLKDMSIRAYEALTTGDIIACEDTRITGKLLTLLKQRKFDEQIKNILHGENSETSIDNIDFNAKDNDEAQEGDENIFTSFRAKEDSEVVHKNLFELRRLKKKMKDFYQENDVNLTKELARQRIQKDDSLGFLGKYETENSENNHLTVASGNASDIPPELVNYPFLKNVSLDNSKNAKVNDDDYFYDSSSKARKKEKEKFEKDPLDDPFISFMKQKIYESKLKKGRGLLISCHRFNETDRIDSLIKLMKAGLKVILVPDAGSPCLSDPGQLLVNETIKNKIIVDALPGPNSVALALGLSGFPGDSYVFNGFFPKNEGDKYDLIKRIKESQTTNVLFENKNRIMNLLLFLEKEMGPQQKVYVAVEMTKLHERNLQGTVEKIYDILNKNPDYTVPSLKGEITVVIAPYTKDYNKDLIDLSNFDAKNSQGEKLKDHYSIKPADLINILREYVDVQTKDLSHIVADILNINKKKAYEFVVKEVRKKDKENKLKKIE